MNLLSKIALRINQFSYGVGQVISWLTLLLVMLVMTVVISRYLLGVGSIAIQESVSYVHAIIFMLGLAFTLQRGGHVRVDIFYREFSPRRKAMVDLTGATILLLPFCGLILVGSWDYVMASWAIKETSSETGGIAAVYLLKTLMIIMPITLGLQGIAQIINSILAIAKANENIEESNNG
ncbi:TRAP transporter small permease subunit [Porticoccaceae bacterium]|jgi:TRAP-type mannitol/chloroaromatic compound transport system permease small subunit|nr:TRAP transporter small permease subunit [Porticoccaceae bacterium]